MSNIEYEMQMKKKGYVVKCSKAQDLSFFLKPCHNLLH